ncbi:MAG: hypothetical protein MUE67_09850 [Anaerolineales bacterium]|jgi:hypothetical protein|nr:hypothetical protein [Anaerolineales bacterium]
MKKLPWLEIILVAVLLLMIGSSISALFGQDIRQAVDNFCAEQELWCAPPTPTPTLTPTPTATPLPTRTPLPSATPDTTPAP